MPPFPSFEFVVPNNNPIYYIITATRLETGTVLQKLVMYYPYQQDNIHVEIYKFMSSIETGEWRVETKSVDRATFETVLLQKQEEEKLIAGIV